MKEVSINKEYIKLGQLLKMVGECSSGTEAKMIILEEKVKVNNEITTQRGKKVYKGDIINIKGSEYKIAKE